ncbi:MAG: acyltransferase [[Pasteurella] mairii]|nr:acyltransferase [[Pasteurella] mairii]
MLNKTPSRVIYFDVLNVLACFAVIALHHNGIVHNYNINTAAWKQALAFEVIFFWAVPVFFMLSGATLLDYRSKYTTKQFFIKRVLRAVIPFLVWSLILLLHSWVIGRFSYKSVTDVFNAIITTKVPHGNVYWFFIPLIALYCFIPVLSLLKDNKPYSMVYSNFYFCNTFLFANIIPFIRIKV